MIDIVIAEVEALHRDVFICFALLFALGEFALLRCDQLVVSVDTVSLVLHLCFLMSAQG